MWSVLQNQVELGIGQDKFLVKEKLMKISFQSRLFHIKRTFRSRDIVIYILDLYRCLKKNKKKQVKQKSKIDCLPQVNTCLKVYSFYFLLISYA